MKPSKTAAAGWFVVLVAVCIMPVLRLVLHKRLDTTVLILCVLLFVAGVVTLFRDSRRHRTNVQ